MGFLSQFFLIDLTIAMGKKTNFQKRVRKFIKNPPATVEKALYILLFAAVVIKSSVQRYENRKTKFGFLSGVLPSGELYKFSACS